MEKITDFLLVLTVFLLGFIVANVLAVSKKKPKLSSEKAIGYIKKLDMQAVDGTPYLFSDAIYQRIVNVTIEYERTKP